MAQTSIEWTEMTWNPTTGCTKISAGCKFCYAEVMSRRLKAMGSEKYSANFKLRIHPTELTAPYHWRKPRIVFVNSMSDLFHKDVPLSFIKEVFKVMNDNPQHTFQVLTKRADLVAKYSPHLTWSSNIWMGVSVEDERVLHRIDSLRQSDAKIKFLSVEPLISRIKKINLKGIDWVIVGGESGPGARQIEKEWIEDIRLACSKNKTAFFFKQWGKKKFNPDPTDPTISVDHPQHAKGGCQLDGRIYRKMPKVSLEKI